jgi:hypothetical protein
MFDLRAGLASCRPSRLSHGLAFGLCLSLGPVLSCTSSAQDLVGCQLVGATLQCVPGVTESPQQQIQQLQQQISSDLLLEGAVQQRIEGV